MLLVGESLKESCLKHIVQHRRETMGKLIDLTGKTFGRLKVIKYLGKIKGTLLGMPMLLWKHKDR